MTGPECLSRSSRGPANSYSLTGVSSAISGVVSGCSASPELAPPNPYGDRSRRRRPRAGKALPSEGDSNPAGPASGVATGVGEANVSGGGAAAVVGSTGAREFQQAMKENHELAMEYIARLLNRTIAGNGPLLRNDIDKFLKRDAVAEFRGFLFPVAKTSGAP